MNSTKTKIHEIDQKVLETDEIDDFCRKLEFQCGYFKYTSGGSLEKMIRDILKNRRFNENLFSGEQARISVADELNHMDSGNVYRHTFKFPETFTKKSFEEILISEIHEAFQGQTMKIIDDLFSKALFHDLGHRHDFIFIEGTDFDGYMKALHLSEVL